MPCCSSSCGGLKREPKFETVFSCRANGTIPVTKYICQWTGLEVVHAEIEGPIVNGYIVIGTQVADEDGLPHTLEHLTFLGSEDYPYKGVLERAANKCYASGTNAWTDVDHTCFTVNTAGGEGFCTFLPVYLDHIFFPLLSDSAFKTEVYHITGKGSDGGAVYLEMQALENSTYERSMNTLLKTLYPPESGYYYNVGGTLQNLRESCTNEKVKKYHKKFYHPRNACVIVCGSVDKRSLFRSLMRTIDKFILRESSPGPLSSIELSPKPWVHEVIPDLTASIEKIVKVSANGDEGGCLVTIGFLGPATQCEFEEIWAMLLLGKYLASGSNSPLQQSFVEGFDNLAASLDFSVAQHKRTAFFFELEHVAKDEKSKVVPRLKKILSEQIEKFDLQRMRDLIRANVQTEVSLMEHTPHVTISQTIMQEFLFGRDNNIGHLKKFEKRLNKISSFEGFKSKTREFWIKILQDRFLKVNWATIYTEPSNELQLNLTLEEEHRISGRKEILGGEGLQKLGQELDNAQIQNSAPIPPNILKNIRVPTTKYIFYHTLNRIHNPSWISGFPVNVCVDDISTNFLHVGLLMDTSSLSPEFRQYLPLFKETILNSPILDDKKHLIPYEQVLEERAKDLQICEMHLGLEVQSDPFNCGSFSHILALGFQMQLERVAEGMIWIKKTLWDTRWQLDRIKAAAVNLIGDAFLLKRDGYQLSQNIMKELVYADNSNVKVTSSLHQLTFLQNLCDKITEQREAEVNELFTVFDSILNVITDPSKMSIHIATNLLKLQAKMNESKKGAFRTILRDSFSFRVNYGGVEKRMTFANYSDTIWMHNIVQLKDEPSNHIICGLSSESNSYLVMIAPGPTSYQDSHLPALLTALRYLTQLEGTFQSKIRGEAPSYSCSASTRVSEGLIYFQLAHCINLVETYRAIATMFRGYLNKTLEWSEDMLQAAKASLIFEIIESEKTPLALASNSLLSYYRNVPGTFSRNLNNKIAKVKLKDMQNAAIKYLKPMFSRELACVVVCPSDQVEDVRIGMKNLGKNLIVKKSFD